ncbi:Restriction endonuclease [Candidatus Pantoea symbiotica]|uniref:Restriction endonuclease n=1 Tax=Candidatus Pantoea symbiotica TaxID=1884370 RepID=A0A1I3W4J3_9GAMM|nr:MULTISPECIES: restriction endonuclease [Pantoea]SFK02362.1 Restriction endonuclease [Pantoea symbiotica]SFU70203.1 Restriction endonuclease [Pantoea sp. YR525]
MSRPLPLNKDLIVCVPKNYSSTMKGKFFESFCADILRRQSFRIDGMEVRKSGMEIDIQATHTPSNEKLYVECKFMQQKIDSSIVDLAFSQSFRAKVKKIALFSISDLGKDAQSTLEDFRMDERIDYSFFDKKEILKSILATGKVEDFPSEKIPAKYTSASLLVHPEVEMTWLLQESENGSPIRLVPFAVDEMKTHPSISKLSEIMREQGFFEGLEITDYFYLSQPELKKNNIILSESYEKEIVSDIILADDLMDYKPCRPKDFVGRDTVQKEIWDYLDGVRIGEFKSRVLSLVGRSGNGKSSLIAMLSSRFKNIKWRNKFFLASVDVRSARGGRFVAEAVVKAFNMAINEGFIKYNKEFIIENIADITSSESFKECMRYLEDNEKVLTIFFDQFEEVFMKEELFGLFKAFERFGLDVSALQSNIVVGFSWRTGITLGDENPAYSMWNNLKDYRVEKRLEQFELKDSSKLISGFELTTGFKLKKPLRTRLIQQAQGYPWLLKKLCIHVFKKLKGGISQDQMLVSQLQISNLFYEDLDRPEKQNACLRFVAKNSPVSQYETTKDFGSDTVLNLISDRMIIKTGEKLSVYWDVFRDYLKGNALPVIPWSYMPSNSPKMISSILNVINLFKKISVDALQKRLNYTRGTLANVIMDLQYFVLIDRNAKGDILSRDSINSLPEFLREHFNSHSVYLNLLEHVEDADLKRVNIKQYEEVIKNTYLNKDGSYPKGYNSRFLAWLQYTGLVSVIGQSVVIYDGELASPAFGVVDLEKRGVKNRRGSLFLAATTPEKTSEVAKYLYDNKNMDYNYIKENKYRNAIQDLVALSFCFRKDDQVIINPKVDSMLQHSSVERVLARLVSDSPAMKILNSYVNKFGEDDKKTLGTTLAEELGRTWKLDTILRYVYALMRYRNFSLDKL